MKKQWLISTVCGLALLAGGCSTGQQPSVSSQATEATTEAATAAATEAITEAATEAATEAGTKEPFSYLTDKPYRFLGGTGLTELKIDENGHITGLFYENAGGLSDNEAPKGAKRKSDFEGDFQNVVKINSYTYSATVGNLTYEKTPGSSEIIQGYRINYTEAARCRENSVFYIYTPGVPRSALPEECSKAVPSNFFDENDKTNVCLLYNETENIVFRPREEITDTN